MHASCLLQLKSLVQDSQCKAVIQFGNIACKTTPLLLLLLHSQQGDFRCALNCCSQSSASLLHPAAKPSICSCHSEPTVVCCLQQSVKATAHAVVLQIQKQQLLSVCQVSLSTASCMPEPLMESLSAAGREQNAAHHTPRSGWLSARTSPLLLRKHMLRHESSRGHCRPLAAFKRPVPLCSACRAQPSCLCFCWAAAATT